MPMCRCGSWFHQTNYDPKRPEDLCYECLAVSVGYSYINREHICENVTSNNNHTQNKEPSE